MRSNFIKTLLRSLYWEVGQLGRLETMGSWAVGQAGVYGKLGNWASWSLWEAGRDEVMLACAEYPWALGSTNPMSKCKSHGITLHFSLQVLILIFAITTLA